ncbi:hypothetical protein BOSE62_130690 [Bosea sp. 62]|uniref:sigma factor-like helix-turn-helix DNA-binding protein n=1 Tax=unclassified Bosea (in: a-proteobacteria) TaxID=2653178 RepID=UPI0012535529|nr:MULTISPECIES: sigma factor-like helix-turn-helix DNA-binding protein [unclassified Bosea (in: a-proteobacteria)]CAD5255914.1 hypothetical protein BOSE7B_120711 [Bosea sp. 7B]CAD5274809.1 hypothetical protein BOSE21B_30202 [Bosea sp. 21B]CAD5275971.1 hypothetical protein BOSE46_30063 [Bosea sp. 46]VVT60060.1 hypothetical protein BOS5A_210851 [Bosea sp. EC-HK365B]VXB53491.1 hypothetical protein BOSE62_130690 [Bosea sp. 62]
MSTGETISERICDLVKASEQTPLTYAEIARKLAVSEGTVSTTIHRLRKAGDLPPAPRTTRQGSLTDRLLTMIELAGGSGVPRRLAILRCGAPAPIAREAILRLRKGGLIRQDEDGLLLAATVNRAEPEPETLGERRAAAGPLANVVAYAMTLVLAGSPDRAAIFLGRAAEWIDGGRLPPSPEATNLYALADLIRFGEGRTYAGKIERIEIGATAS